MILVQYNGYTATKGKLKAINNHNAERNVGIKVEMEERIVHASSEHVDHGNVPSPRLPHRRPTSRTY
jgi:hypothetical protein